MQILRRFSLQSVSSSPGIVRGSRRLQGDGLRERALVTRLLGDGHAGVELDGFMLSKPANRLLCSVGGNASEAIGRVSVDDVSDIFSGWKD